MRSSARALVAGFLSLPSLFGAVDVAAQRAPASVRVHVVSGSDGSPLAGAQILIDGQATGAVTRPDGMVRLDGVRGGVRRVSARFLGYAEATTQITLSPARTTVVELTLTPRPIELAEVTVEARPSRLHSSGFLRRRNFGIGTYFTRQEIASTHARSLSDLMRRVPGATVYTNRANLGTPLFRGGQSNCPVQYFVDGVPTFDFRIDEMRVADVEGMEIYRGAASIPPEFNRGTALCGVIVIWTRESS